MSSRKRRSTGPQTAAGLVRFFEDVQSRFTVSPTLILLAASVFTAAVVVLNLVALIR